MTQLPKSLYTVLLLLALGMQSIFAQNLLINGDFESGGAGVGFQSNYNLSTTPGVSNPGNYLLTTNSFTMNNANFCNSSDHTTGFGKMMVVDGSGNAGDKFWELVNGGTIGVISGRTYQFSYWIRSISATNTAANSAIIAVNTNGTTGPRTLLSGPTQCPLGNPSAWTKVTYQWVATTNSAQIWMTNTQTVGGGVGNDFAIDDISLVAILPPLSITSSSVNPSCPNANNGSIIANGVNGVPPYVTYTLSGTSSATNSTGVFNNLAPGTYSVSVLDSGGTQVSQNGISIVDPANISITATSTSICVGNTVTLTANGAAAYTWSSTPNDPSITNINATSQTVQPTVPTTYSISANTSSTTNLITNGNFSSGNTGFTSNYQYYTVAPVPNSAQNAYGVVTSPSAWFNPFTNCGDHTTGTGNMLVADGATTPNSIVWRQTVPVVSNRVYNFGFWIQSVVSNNPANIEVFINGVSVGFRLAPTDINCTSAFRWVQYSTTWNSLASSSADIVLYNRNTNLSGNDFAIDDISLTTASSCSLSASKTITVNPIPVITAAVTSQPTCTSPLGTITVSSPIGTTYEYSIDGTTYQSSPSFLNLAANTYPVRVRIVGTNCSSLPLSLTISSVAALPNVSATTGVAPNCGVKLIGNSTTAGVQLTWNGPGLAANSPNPATATQNGTFTLTAYDPVSGCSNATTVIATLPTLPTTPLINTTQPSCVTNTGNITVTAPLGANFEYSINGTNYQSGTLFSNVSPNTYNVLVRNNTTGCVSLPNTIQINSTISTPPPTVTTPIYYCQNSNSTALSVTPNAGNTLKWYTVASGGTASTVAPIPNTGAVGNFIFYVSQTNGICESTRVPIVVKVTQNFNESLNLFCDATRSTPTSVFFDWSNVTGWVGYNYTYSIAGGPLVTGYTSAASSISIPVASPGTSVTFTITSVVGAPCVASDTETCNSTCTTLTNPNFANIAPLCSGSVAPILANTSPNGISGTWNPAVVSNTTAGNYVFTPNNLLFPCANTQTLSVAVTTPVTPTFASIPTTYCQSTTAPIIVLPTSSTNTTAITGTWNPGGINQFLVGTTTHTFTPDTGQCVSSTPVTLSVTVNPIVSPNFPTVGPLCTGSTAPILASTSPNGITGTWLPTSINNTSPGNYVFTPNANQCSAPQSLSVTILNKTISNFPAIPSICGGSTAPILATVAPNGVIGTWSPATVNNLNTGNYTFTPDTTLYTCIVPQVLSIAVTSPVTPTFTGVPVLCENSIPPVLPTSSTNTPPILGTWNSPIDTTILGNTLYTFTAAANQCVVSANSNMQVNVQPIVTPNFASIG
ncbi:MAG: beta strand repeat-containing protein, partial [Flavobacterium sp.]